MECQVCTFLSHEDGWIVQELGFLLWAVLSLRCPLLTGAVHVLVGWLAWFAVGDEAVRVTLQGYGRLSVSSTFRFALYGLYPE